jgi:hypothetical protein
MALERYYITGVPGQTEVYHPAIAYSQVMLVLREGKGLVETSVTPAGRQFKADTVAAKIILDSTLPILTGAPGPFDPSDLGTPEEFYIELKS